MTKIGGGGVRGPLPPAQQSTDQVSADQAGKAREKDKPEEKAGTEAQAQTHATRADEFEIARPNPFKTLGGMGKATPSTSEQEFKHELGNKLDQQGAAQVKQELGRGGDTGFKAEAHKAGHGVHTEGKLHSTPSLIAQPSAGATAGAKASQDIGHQQGHAATASQQSRTHESPSERRGDVTEQRADIAQRREDVTEQRADVKQPRSSTTEQPADPNQRREGVTEQRADLPPQTSSTSERPAETSQQRGDVTDSEASPVDQEESQVRRSAQELRDLQLEMENKLRKRPG